MLQAISQKLIVVEIGIELDIMPFVEERIFAMIKLGQAFTGLLDNSFESLESHF